MLSKCIILSCMRLVRVCKHFQYRILKDSLKYVLHFMMLYNVHSFIFQPFAAWFFCNSSFSHAMFLSRPNLSIQQFAWHPISRRPICCGTVNVHDILSIVVSVCVCALFSISLCLVCFFNSVQLSHTLVCQREKP